MGLVYLFFEGEDIGKWVTISITVVGFIVLVAAALIIVLSKKRDDVVLMSDKRAEQAEKMLALSEKEVKGLQEDLMEKDSTIEKLKDDLESVKAEHIAVAGIIVKDVIGFYENSKQILADKDLLEIKMSRLVDIINTLDRNYFKDAELKRKALITLQEFEAGKGKGLLE